MTTKESSLIKAFGGALVVIAIVAVVVIWQQATSPQKAEVFNQVNAKSEEDVEEVVVSPKISDVHSGDGKKKLIMKAQVNKDGTTSYTFTSADIGGTVVHPVYTKTVAKDTVMSIPANSWTPDNKLLFIQENGPSGVNYYVFHGDGTPFADGSLYIDVRPVFEARETGYALRTATGWASETLLIIYTSKEDGTSGPHYWLEIPSKAVMQLAS